MSTVIKNPVVFRTPYGFGNGVYRDSNDSYMLGYLDFPHRGYGFDPEIGAQTDDLIIYIARGYGGDVTKFGQPFLYQVVDKNNVQYPTSLFAGEQPLQEIGRVQFPWNLYSGGPWIIAWAKKATRLDQKYAKVYRIPRSDTQNVKFNYNQFNIMPDTFSWPQTFNWSWMTGKSNQVTFGSVTSPDMRGISTQYNKSRHAVPPGSANYPFYAGSNFVMGVSQANYDEFYDKAFAPGPNPAGYLGAGAAVGNGHNGDLSGGSIRAWAELVPSDGRVLDSFYMNFDYSLAGGVPAGITIPWCTLRFVIKSAPDDSMPESNVKMYEGFKESFTSPSALNKFTVLPDSEVLVPGVPSIQ